MFAPPYSQESAIGLIMAVGNEGEELIKTSLDRTNTYLSRDGGLTWQEVKKGPYIYDYGDHGGLIVMAKNQEPTQEIIYSYNEGKTWLTLEVSSVPIHISNIIIEPLSISQQFIVYGKFY